MCYTEDNSSALVMRHIPLRINSLSDAVMQRILSGEFRGIGSPGKFPREFVVQSVFGRSRALVNLGYCRLFFRNILARDIPHAHYWTYCCGHCIHISRHPPRHRPSHISRHSSATSPRYQQQIADLQTAAKFPNQPRSILRCDFAGRKWMRGFTVRDLRESGNRCDTIIAIHVAMPVAVDANLAVDAATIINQCAPSHHDSCCHNHQSTCTSSSRLILQP
jgi:hypothetical protein